MFRCAGALLCALLALSLLDNPVVLARKSYGGGRHSYPSSHSGLSGGSHGHSSGHGYPSSGGLSGGGSSHGYPSSGGMSGSSHGYPSSGGMSGSGHGYPSSGSHGYPSSGSHGYPSSGSHNYPAGGLSGSGSNNKYPPHHSNNHGYPASNGLSGSSSSGHKTTVVHHHYHYSPPQQIRYVGPAGSTMHYPVYRGTPPTYVYQYKDSSSKYGTLLAGLALFNLGALAGTAYGHRSSTSYTPKPGEVCKFGVRKDNGDYEETKIQCDMITSFIWAEESKTQNTPAAAAAHNTTVITTTTVTNVTTVNSPNNTVVPPQTNYTMLPNGTLVPIPGNNSTVPVNSNSTSSTVVTTTVTNTTQVVDALDPKNKGPPVQVTPGMQCYVIRHTPTSNLKKTVPCAVLQSYAEQSLKRNNAANSAPSIMIVAAAIIAYVVF